MPQKKNAASAKPLRKSERPHARVKIAEAIGPGGKMIQKRPRGRPPAVQKQQSNSTTFGLPKKPSDDQKPRDRYCWLCHKDWPRGDKDQRWVCSSCPRVYHHSCLGPTHRFTEDGVCCECCLETTDGTPVINGLPANELGKILRVVLRSLVNSVPVFKAWPVDVLEPKKKCVQMMELALIEDRLKFQPSVYSTTGKFLSDVKWIHHNAVILYGTGSAMVAKAKNLVKLCRGELNNLEACSECYVKSLLSKDKFTELCNDPHTLVWAKMKGFPYWPAKVLKVIDGTADVRFFGSHEKTRIPVANCLMLSENSPNGNKVRYKNSYDLARKELEEYVANFKEKYNKFTYSLPHVPYNPGSFNFITKFASKHPYPSSKAASDTKSKRGRPPKTKSLQTCGQNIEKIVHDISGDSCESEEDSDVEIIETVSNGHNRNHLSGRVDLSSSSPLRSSQRESDTSTSCIDSEEYFVENQVIQRSPNRVEMIFDVAEQEETGDCSDTLLQFQNVPISDKNKEKETILSADTVSSVIQDMISTLENSTSSGIHALNGLTKVVSSVPDSQHLDVQIAYSDSSHTANVNQPLIGGSVQEGYDYSSMYTLPNGVGTAHNAFSIPAFVNKHSGKVMSAVQSSMHEMCNDLVNVIREENPVQIHIMQKKIEELELKKKALEDKAESIKVNTDTLINNMKKSFKRDIMKAVEDTELSLKKNQEKEKELLEAQLKEKFSQELEKRTEELKSKFEEEKLLAVDNAKNVIEKKLTEQFEKEKEEWEIEKAKTISEVKRNAWVLDVC